MAYWGHFRNASRENGKNSKWNISIGQSLFVMFSYLPVCIYIHILHICAWCCCFLLIFWHRRGKTVRPHTCMRIELCSSILVCSTCTSHDILIYNHFGQLLATLSNGRVRCEKICHSSPSNCHPQLAGFSISGWHWVAWANTQTARLVCWSKAALVGGIASQGLCFLVNMSSLASSTVAAVLDLSYTNMTNFSSISRSPSSTVRGYWLSLEKTGEASGQMSHVCHVVFLPLLRKADRVSQPVKAWKNNMPFLLTHMTHVMCTDPAQAVTLPKCYPQLLQPQPLKNGEHTKCNNNICVICLNHDCFAPMLRSKLGMYKYAAISFLVIAIVQSIKTNFMSAEDIRSICDNNQIWCQHLGNHLCKELKQLHLVVTVPEEVAPMWWNCVLLCNLTCSSLTAFGSGVCFKTGRAVHVKDYVCHVILAPVCLYHWQEVQSCIALKSLLSPRWLGMHQCWTIHDEGICLGFLVYWYYTSLKDKYELWLLAIVQPSTLTQRSWLVLMLEERLQIALSAVTGDEQLCELLAILLQKLLLWQFNRSRISPEKVNIVPPDRLIERDWVIRQTVQKLLEFYLTPLHEWLKQCCWVGVSNVFYIKWVKVLTFFMEGIAQVL